jgi:uncharacterized membrane protein
MDKVLVVVFDGESGAWRGSKALQDLQNEGSINLYAKAVVARDASGAVAIKEESDMGPIGTTVGLLTGSLIGVFGGPVGLAIGAGAGMYGGVLYDLAELGIGEDFLYEVGAYLQPGKAAVVAEVWEEWTLPVDMRMEALGGVVFRRMRGEILDAQIERDVAALDAELAELEAERDQATGEAKARLQAKINATKAKLQAMQDGIQTRMETSKQETEAKVKSLQEQAGKARGERKAKLEAGIAELRAKQEKHDELLEKSWELTKQALEG